MCVEAKVCVWEAGLKKGVGAGGRYPFWSPKFCPKFGP